MYYYCCCQSYRCLFSPRSTYFKVDTKLRHSGLQNECLFHSPMALNRCMRMKMTLGGREGPTRSLCMMSVYFTETSSRYAFIPVGLYSCMPLCLYDSMPVCLSACMPLCLYASMPVCLYAFMPLCLYACMSAYLHACMTLCLYAWVCVYVDATLDV